jgi:multimeric flavodoxin WrbA
MRILAINGTSRKEGTTTRLTGKALEGAASEGATTEMILLTEKDIGYCTNCLTCYNDLESRIARCTIDDDVYEILEKIADADGVLFTSPVHCGFVSALMTTFIHRTAWTLLRPTGEILGLKGCPNPRLTDKTRAVATIVSAGCIPTELRKYCDTGSPWLQDMGAAICNGECVGDMYAGAFFSKELEGEEWSKAFFFRELTEDQLQQAYDLGKDMARAVKEKRIRSYDPMRLLQSIERE